MIRRFQALGYRCLRYVDLELDDFQVLVGDSASGKSTLFDALTFIGDLVEEGVFSATTKRSANFQDLVWNRPDRDLGFELALEVEIPSSGPTMYRETAYDRIRYEVAVREDSAHGLHITGEQWFPLVASAPETRSGDRFPDPPPTPETLFTPFGDRLPVCSPKDLPGGGDRTPLDLEDPGDPTRRRESAVSALGRLPLSRAFPVDRWLKDELRAVTPVSLDSEALRRPGPPSPAENHLDRSGSNLPGLVEKLKTKGRGAYDEWIDHVRTAIPELAGVETIVRPEDGYAYLMVRYASGLCVPSWTVAEGTLRLLALTLPAYLEPAGSSILVDAPEKGIHLKALDIVCDSLYSVYDSQVLVSTHSPAVLRRTRPEKIRCLARDDDGATDIVRGDQHPLLKNWKDEVDTTALFAMSVVR